MIKDMNTGQRTYGLIGYTSKDLNQAVYEYKLQ